MVVDPREELQPVTAGGDGLLVAVLDRLPVGVAILGADAEHRILHCNELFTAWLPDEVGSPVGLCFADVVPNAETNHLPDVFAEIVRTGESRHFRNFLYVGFSRPRHTLPGDVTVWNWDLFPLRDPDGHIARLLSIGSDVTEQVVTRQALLQAQERALTALSAVVPSAGRAEDLPAFLGRLTAAVGGLIGAGAVAFLRLQSDDTLAVEPGSTGLPPTALSIRDVPCSPDGADLAGRVVHLDEAFNAAVDPHELARHGAWLEDLDPGHVVAVSWRAGDDPLGALVAFHPLNREPFGDEAVNVLRAAALAGALVWQQKETERRVAALSQAENDKLREHSERLSQLEQVKSQFLNLASHELRGPLTILRGYLTMLEDGSLPDIQGAARSVLPTLLGKVGEMDRLVSDMLDAARLEDSRLQLRFEEFDLREVLTRVVTTLQPLDAAGQRVRVEVPDAPVEVRGDRARIEAIVANLVSNALKYSPGGGEVDCHITVADGTARTAVRDRGLGIAPADLPRLFTRFGRIVTSENSHIQGTGLGLYLARELATLHHGEIAVTTQPGEGSTFTLTLPLRAPDAG